MQAYKNVHMHLLGKGFCLNKIIKIGGVSFMIQINSRELSLTSGVHTVN